MEINDPKKEPVIDHEFARRMKIACDNNPRAPEKAGRLVWIRDEMAKKGMLVAHQTVHRWYHGATRPRNQKMSVLADVLRVDPAWLAMGRYDHDFSLNPERRAVIMDGAINATVGFMEMAGINCAWPDEGDPAASYVHFYAIIKGKQHRFYVAKVSDNYQDGIIDLRLPLEFDKCSIIVFRRIATSTADLWFLPKEILANSAVQRGSYADIKVKIKGTVLDVGQSNLAAITDLARAF